MIKKDKLCSKCGTVKALDKFYTDNSKKDKKCSWCKDCCKKTNYYANNKDKVLAQQRKRYRENIVEERKKKREQYYKHKGKRTEYVRAYRKANRKKINNRYKKYYNRKKELISKKSKKYWASHKKEAYAYSFAKRNKDKLMKPKCEVCQSDNDLQMHHPDYDKPEWVITLCRTHHKEIHMLDKLN